MLSIIITAYKEAETIKKCVKSITSQDIKKNYEIIVIAPDKETRNAAKKASKKVITFKDKGKGKPAALNIGLKKSKGDLIILTDGDVYLGKNSIDNLLKHLEKKQVGAVSGRVISTNKKKNMMDYWSHLLTSAAHKERLRRDKNNDFLICTGYLYGFKKLFKKIPEDLLSEDAYISHKIWKMGYDINYEPKAKVYVKYPTNFNDWIKQKRRSAGGYHQLKKYFPKNPRMRTVWTEILRGPKRVLSYAKTIRQLVWSLVLFPARLYLWILTYYDKFSGKKFGEIWKRVESTKQN